MKLYYHSSKLKAAAEIIGFGKETRYQYYYTTGKY
jgi:hypothetical protein